MADFPEFLKLDKKFDFFNATLGIALIAVATYLFLKYYIDANLSQGIVNNFLISIITILYFLGAFFFIIGYSDMDYNYSLDIDIKELRYLVDFKDLRSKIDMSGFNLSKSDKKKLEEYTDNMIKDFIRTIESSRFPKLIKHFFQKLK